MAIYKKRKVWNRPIIRLEALECPCRDKPIQDPHLQGMHKKCIPKQMTSAVVSPGLLNFPDSYFEVKRNTFTNTIYATLCDDTKIKNKSYFDNTLRVLFYNFNIFFKDLIEENRLSADAIGGFIEYIFLL